MNEVDIEQSRLNARIAVTWFAILIGVSVIIYFIIQIFRSVTDFDVSIILGSIITIVIAERIRPYIRRFYEKRLIGSKQGSHIT